MKGIKADTVDEYIAQVPDEQRATLEHLRDLIRSLAPDAAESISYGIPTYKIGGKPLVYFGTAKKHFALYALSQKVRDAHTDSLAGYEQSKGTIRFPYGEEFPGKLIKKLVREQLKDRNG